MSLSSIIRTLLLPLLLFQIACQDEEPSRLVYTLQPLEIEYQHLYVVHSDGTADSTGLTTTQDSFAYHRRILRFPDYLELHTIRSFTKLDDMHWLVTIVQQDGLLPYTDSVSLNGDRFVQLPDYRYDAEQDVIYQCDRSVRLSRGPTSSTFGRTFSIPCDQRLPSIIADSVAANTPPLDTLLVSELRLPYRQL